MKSDYPNLRTWDPSDSEAKDVMDTNMLDTNATETPDTVTAENKNEELVNPTPSLGELGARGRS